MDRPSNLTYRSYAMLRDLAPTVNPKHWAPIYGTDIIRALERQYQLEGRSKNERAPNTA
jgi:hypothetical protein